MLLSYNECIEQYGSDYKIKKAIQDGRLYKLASGVYSDKRNEPDTAVVQKKYPNAVFTLNSAFYYHGLTDTIPDYYYLITDKDASKIKDESVKQIFDNNNSLTLGVEVLEYNGSDITVFSKERLLIELVRNRRQFSFDYYKEIINNYRRRIHELDFQSIEEYAEQLPKTKMVMDTILKEVI